MISYNTSAIYRYVFILFFGVFTLTVSAQDKGDEDKTMANQEKARDRSAIDDAINGWRKVSMKTHDGRGAWWHDARFGMFIHWGIYSLGRGY